MAEDLMIGFKFHDREDNLAEDALVLKSADNLFSEATEMFGAKSAPTGDMGMATETFDGAGAFDFTEGFDFIM